MLDAIVNMGLAAGLILLALLGWIAVQQLARNFAVRHPEFGPAREEGSGCGSGCSCSAGQCSANKTMTVNTLHQEFDQ